MAKILNITINPDPILRQRSREIKPEELPGLRELFADMALTMREKDGVGLAAPQIGRTLRIIAVAVKDKTLLMVNPILKKPSFFKEWGEEGCLSVPGIFGQVRRHRSLACDYLDEKGQTQTITASGLLARILQHEVDHLDGILFIDKVRNLEKAGEQKPL